MSTTTLDQDKADLIEKAIDRARTRKGTGGPPHDVVDVLLPAYYRHVAPEDVIGRGDVDLYGALASHWKLAGDRPQGTARVRVFTPSLGRARLVGRWAHGGRGRHRRHAVPRRLADHGARAPAAQRARGRPPALRRLPRHHRALESVTPVADGSLEPEGAAVRESWMHVEIDRVREGDDTDAIEQAVQRVLRDVRESVEDWEKMHAQVQAVVEDLDAHPAAAARRRDRPGP